MNETIRESIEKMVNTSRDVVACSIDDQGYPNAKALFVARHKGMHTFWFSTNTSSIRAGQWEKRPQACLYFLDSGHIQGVMFTGKMEIVTDAETKQSFWHTGDEKYYPLGPTDPDYCILRFTAEKGNYYHGLQKHLFDVSGTEA